MAGFPQLSQAQLQQLMAGQGNMNPGLTGAGGVFNNVAFGQPTPFDANQSLTGVQEQGLNNLNIGQNQINQGFNTSTAALGQEGQAGGTMQQGVDTLQGGLGTIGQGLGTINQAGGLQNQAIGQIDNANPAANSIANSATGQLNNILSGNNLSPNSNPYLAQMAQAANQETINQYQEAVAPGLQAQATQAYGGPGATQGSAFQQAQANNEQALGQTLANNTANIYGQNYANAQNQITSALGQAGAVQNTNYTPANQTLNAAQSLLNTGQTQVGAGAQQAGVGSQQVNAGSQQLGLANTTNNIGATQAGIGNQSVNAGATQFGAGSTQYGQQQQGIDQLLGIGTLQQQQQQTGLNAATGNATQANQFGNQELSQLGSLLGQATGGTGNQVSVGTQSK
jgi:hypothetical protein